MQTSLRKMGNSTGLIVPRPLLQQIGAASGSAMELSVEDGRLVAVPVAKTTRAGWAAAAAMLEEDDAPEWRGFANEDDDNFQW